MKKLFYTIVFITGLLLFIGCKKTTVNNIGSTLRAPVANAGPLQQLNFPANSTTLTGTGSSENGPIVGYLWSLVSGPNVPGILSPSSPSTIVNNLVLGQYRFQFAVIDSAGLTGVDTVSVWITQGPVQTLTLQPSNSPSELLMVQTTPNNYSDPNSPEIIAEAWTSGGAPFNIRNLLKFDLSAIPAGSTILSAKLSLYSDPNPINGNLVDANYGPNNSMYLEKVTGNWSSTTLWQNQPSTDVAGRLSIPHTSLSQFDLIDIDVTSLMNSPTGINLGFLLRLQNESIYNSRIFCSSRHVNASKHPKLVITYQ